MTRAARRRRMRGVCRWLKRNRLKLGLASLALSGGYLVVLVLCGAATAQTVGIIYVAVVVTISLGIDVIGAWGERRL